jgi:hypothetical protein
MTAIYGNANYSTTVTGTDNRFLTARRLGHRQRPRVL